MRGLLGVLLVLEVMLGLPTARAEAQELLDGTVVRFVGDQADDSVWFGRIAGVALLDDGSFVVADDRGPQLLLFGRGGDILDRRSGSGQGPGDLYYPCCLSVEGADRVWLLNLNAAGFQIWTVLDGDRLQFLDTRVAPANLLRRPAMFDVSGGPLFAVRSREDPKRIELVGRASDGDSVVRFGTVQRAARGDGDPVARPATFRHPTSGRRVVQMIPPPFGSGDLIALSNHGDVAVGSTERLEITILSPNGEVLAEISGNTEPPRVTDDDWLAEEQRLGRVASMIANLGGEFDSFGRPAHMPPLGKLWFDDDRRLWVELRVPAGSPWRRALIYSRLGDRLFEARWPSDVSLSVGATRGLRAIGVKTDSLDVQSLALLDFRPGAQGDTPVRAGDRRGDSHRR